MIVIWNYGAIAQLFQGWAQSVWNWSGPAGADVLTENRPVCGTLAAAPVVNGTLAVVPLVNGTLAVAPVVNGTLAVEDC